MYYAFEHLFEVQSQHAQSMAQIKVLDDGLKGPRTDYNCTTKQSTLGLLHVQLSLNSRHRSLHMTGIRPFVNV